VGLLSYTFLRRTGQDDVVVPMVTFPSFNVYIRISGFVLLSYFYSVSFSLQIDFDISGHWAEPIIYSSQHEWSANLKTILDWSPFTSKEELMLQVHFISLYIHKNLSFGNIRNNYFWIQLSFFGSVSSSYLPVGKSLSFRNVIG